MVELRPLGVAVDVLGKTENWLGGLAKLLAQDI